MCAGMEFDDLDPHEQANAVGQLAVLSRVEPSHKTRLVELLKGQVFWCGGHDRRTCI